MKQYCEALTHFTSALAIRERLKNPRGIIYILGNVSQVYQRRRQYKGVLDQLEKSVELSDSLQDKISST